MNCLLIAATAGEIAPALAYYRESDKNWLVEFELDVLITGVGLLSTTYALTRHLAVKRPDFIVQAGIAGSFDPRVQLASVFAVKSEQVADLGVWEQGQWRDLFDLKFQKPNKTPFKQKKLVNPHLDLLKRTGLPLAHAVTVNQISSAKNQIQTWKDKYKPVLETMEGAALHYIGLQENIPFLQLRGISNYIGERNKKKWKLAESVATVNKELIRLFESI
jgi:futalosine hydrolase